MTDLPYKWIIRPGNVRSINDGQTHFIDAYELMNLYGVIPGDCVIVECWRRASPTIRSLRGTIPELKPDSTGCYIKTEFYEYNLEDTINVSQSHHSVFSPAANLGRYQLISDSLTRV